MQRLKQHLIAYADDLLFKWMLNKQTDFTQALHQIGCIMDGVEPHDLQISMDKTVIIMRLVGSKARSIIKHHIQHYQCQKWIAIQRQCGTSWVRVVDKHTFGRTDILWGLRISNAPAQS